MKIVELVNKLSLPITNEESDVLGQFQETPEIRKAEFNEREQELANSLVNKDILLRHKNEEGRIIYKRRKGIN
jgi:hypothetical protein|tara:strand:- start:367 stop:585 length:219 start_codon:yes stop_codon:yes gene_type:complete